MNNKSFLFLFFLVSWLPDSLRAVDTKISDMSAASSVSGADIVPIVQSGTNKKASFTVQKTLWDTYYQPLNANLTAIGALVTHYADYALQYEFDSAVHQTTFAIANATDGAGSDAQLEIDSDSESAVITVYATSFGVSGIRQGGDTQLYTTSRLVMAANGPVLFSNDGGDTERVRIGAGLSVGTGTDPGAGNIAASGTVIGSNMPAGAIVGTSDAQTLTNKRITARITSISSSATPAINTDNCDAVTITALATNITSMTSSLSGSPNNFDKLTIRFKDNGTGRSITWGASFTSSQATLPTTTVASKVTTVNLTWDAVKTKWVCLATDQEP